MNKDFEFHPSSIWSSEEGIGWVGSFDLEDGLMVAEIGLSDAQGGD